MSLFRVRKTRTPKLLSVAQLAELTDTTPNVLASLTAYYDWTERTRLQKENFIRMRDEWLSKEANK